jgi:hypothetical protein
MFDRILFEPELKDSGHRLHGDEVMKVRVI